MKRLILLAAALALVAGTADVANAKTSHRAHGGLVERNVALPYADGYHANADFRYGPQVDYPQSPAGGGY